MSTYQQLLADLKPLGRRLRLRASVELLVRTLWFALGIAALILLVSRFVPLEHYQLWSIGWLIVWFIGWFAYNIVHPLPPFAVARRADAELALHDRLATALILAAPNYSIPAGISSELVARQLDDALAHLSQIDPARAFPIRLARRPLVAALALGLAVLALWLIPNPMDAVLAERRLITQTAQSEAAKLEKLAHEIEQNQALNPQDKKELLNKLRELAAQLKSNSGDVKQALAEVAKLQDVLRAGLDLNRAPAAAALAALAQQMAELANTPNVPRDAAELAKLLEQLASDPNALSAEPRAALAEALNQTAAQVAAGNPDLAHALAQLSQALRANASDESLRNALAQTARALENAAQQQALQQELARALNQVEATQQALARAGRQTTGSQTARGQTSTSQTSSGQGQGNQGTQGTRGQGRGTGNQPGSGGGTNVDSLPPANRTGTMGNPTGPNKSFSTDHVGTVYAPFHVGQGERQKVSGQENANGQTTTRTEKSPLPGANNPALVPYTQVFQQYREIAGKFMEQSYIPLGLRDYVKEYFSALEP